MVDRSINHLGETTAIFPTTKIFRKTETFRITETFLTTGPVCIMKTDSAAVILISTRTSSIGHMTKRIEIRFRSTTTQGSIDGPSRRLRVKIGSTEIGPAKGEDPFLKRLRSSLVDHLPRKLLPDSAIRAGNIFLEWIL